jgi:hypothetical protein
MPTKDPKEARSAPDLLPAVADGLAAEDLLELPDPLPLPLPPPVESVADALADVPDAVPMKEGVRVQSHDEL